MPEVSIITPSYNSAPFIEESVRSVFSQTFQDWELLIVDDCSKDNSVGIVQELTKIDNRVQLVALQENIGASEARNVAIRKAKGRYIAFLD